MPNQFDPPSGTRDFLARETEIREHAFGRIRSVFARYGFEPLATPAFERLDVLLGKYGDDGDKLIFKILRRGEHGRRRLRQPAADPVQAVRDRPGVAG